jgi:hypothetical protein
VLKTESNILVTPVPASPARRERPWLTPGGRIAEDAEMTSFLRHALIVFAVVFSTSLTLSMPDVLGSRLASIAEAKEARAKTASVRGYTKKNGTHVKAYKRAQRAR